MLNNIKNELISTNTIELIKSGGISKDKSEIFMEMGDLLPEVGRVYLFLAYTNPDDRSLRSSGVNSTIAFDHIADSDIEKTDLYQKYMKAYQNQVFGEYRFKDDLTCIFDASMARNP